MSGQDLAAVYERALPGRVLGRRDDLAAVLQLAEIHCIDDQTKSRFVEAYGHGRFGHAITRREGFVAETILREGFGEFFKDRRAHHVAADAG